MPLIRNTKQGKKPLIKFYKELHVNSNDYYNKISELMTTLIERLEPILQNTIVYGLTSHDRLLLQTEDNYTSKVWLIIYARFDFYYIEYAMPENIAPWKDAWVTGSTKSIDEATKMIRMAMLRSGGWETVN